MNKKKLFSIFSIVTVIALVFTMALPTNVYASDSGEITTTTVGTLPENNNNTSVDVNGQSGNNNGSQGTTNTNNTNGGSGVNVNLTPSPITENDLVNTVINSDATIETLGNKIIGKLYEFAGLMQRAAVPIALIGFIVGAVLVLWGAFSKRATILPGVLTMVAGVALYTLAIYAPQIVVWMSRWLVE